jgi:hypothetical protein
MAASQINRTSTKPLMNGVMGKDRRIVEAKNRLDRVMGTPCALLESRPAKFMRYRRLLIASLFDVSLAATPRMGQCEARMIIGPSEPDEAPEVVETVSGLSYDQLKRLRELRKWLEERQLIREQIQLQNAESRRLNAPEKLFADRQLFAPLGQRYVESPPKPARLTPEQMKLPPLPRFLPAKPAASTKDAGHSESVRDPFPLDDDASEPVSRQVTHITPPPPAEDQPQVEYELNPER